MLVSLSAQLSEPPSFAYEAPTCLVGRITDASTTQEAKIEKAELLKKVLDGLLCPLSRVFLPNPDTLSCSRQGIGHRCQLGLRRQWHGTLPSTLHLILNAFLSKKLQAMDNSHIALVSLELNRETFLNYRCDRNMSLGMNLGSLTKILKCANANDEVKITASDDSDVLGLDFQNRRRRLELFQRRISCFCVSDADRMGQYEMKLMDIDQGDCLHASTSLY
jgi:hypothetical protein